MKKNIKYFISVVFILVFSHLSLCYSDEINLEELKNIVKKRIDICNPIWVKYQVNTTHTSDFFKRLSNNPQNIIDGENITFDCIMEWAQKGDKLRFSCIAPGMYDGKIVEQPKENIFVFDGKLVINNDLDYYLNDPNYPLYSISNDKTQANVYESLPDLSGDTGLYR